MNANNSSITHPTFLQLALSHPSPLREEYLAQLFRNLFKGPDNNIHGLMVNCSSSFNQHHSPDFNKNEDYKNTAEIMQERINSNLALLKKHCMELNWLEDYIYFYSQDPTYQNAIDWDNCYQE